MRALLAALALALTPPAAAQAGPSSDIVRGEEGQLFLKQSIILDADLDTAWALYTTSEGASQWMAPKVEVDLMPGGSLRSQYDPNAAIGDPGTVEVSIVNYAPRSFLTLQADLSELEAEWLTPEVRAASDQLYNVVTFEALGPRRTRVTSWGIGYREGPGWEKMIAFFTAANEWTLGELQKAAAASTEPLPEPASPAVAQLRQAIGDWQVVTHFLRPDGSVRVSVPGTYTFEWVEPDSIVMGKSELEGLGASGLLFFVRPDADEVEMVSVGGDKRVWRMVGPDDSETRETGVETMPDGSTIRLRFTRSNVQPDSFESRMFISSDGGESWNPGNHQLFTRCPATGCVEPPPALVWNRYTDGEWAIMGFDDDGEVTRLSPSGENHWVWGRRGDRLIAHVMRETPEGKRRWHAQTLALDATGSTLLAPRQSDDGQWDCHPTGDYCLIVEPHEGNDRILKLSADGTIVPFMQAAGHGYSDPQFSLDGTRLAYRSNREGTWEIYLARPDGSDAVRLTDDKANDQVERHWYGGEGPPVFAPDGKHIYWTRRFPDRGFDIWSMKVDGSEKRNLTVDHSGSDSYPYPSPDGRWIAFNSDRDGNDEIYVMRTDGTDLTRVTFDDATDLAPVWRTP